MSVTVLSACPPVAIHPTWLAGSTSPTINVDIFRILNVVKTFPAQLASVVSAKSAFQVFGSRHGFHVFWINATTDAAEVIKVKTLRYFVSEFKKECSVSQPRFMKRTAHLSIPIVVDPSGPEPASVLANDIPGPVINARIGSGAMGLHAPIMLRAHATPKTTRSAFQVVDGAHHIHDPNLVHPGGDGHG